MPASIGKPHLHSLFATFTESRRLCLLFQRFQAVFPLFNALSPLQSRSFSAFTFYRSFTPCLFAVPGDLSRYTPLSVAMPIGRAIRPYSHKIQAESGIKKPSRPLRPFFTHLSSFKAPLTLNPRLIPFFPHISFHKQTITLINSFCAYKKEAKPSLRPVIPRSLRFSFL